MERSSNPRHISWRYVLPGVQVLAMVFVNLLASSALRAVFYLLNLPALLASVATVVAISEITKKDVPEEVMLWATALFLLPLWYALGRWVDRLTGSLPPREHSTSEMAAVGDIAAILVVGLLVYFSLGATVNVSIGAKLANLQMKHALTAWLVVCELLLLLRLMRRWWARRRAAE